MPLSLLSGGDFRRCDLLSLLKPTAALNHVTDISPRLLKRLGTDAILLDVDNTLAPPTSHIPYDGVKEWIEQVKGCGISIVICSNNYKKRVKPFSDSLGLDCVAMSLKPFPFGFNRAKRKLHEKPQSVLVVGDQIYTDVLGANLAGMKSILLNPRNEEHGFSIWLRRKMEKGIRKKIKMKREREKNVVDKGSGRDRRHRR